MTYYWGKKKLGILYSFVGNNEIPLNNATQKHQVKCVRYVLVFARILNLFFFFFFNLLSGMAILHILFFQCTVDSTKR